MKIALEESHFASQMQCYLFLFTKHLVYTSLCHHFLYPEYDTSHMIKIVLIKPEKKKNQMRYNEELNDIRATFIVENGRN